MSHGIELPIDRLYSTQSSEWHGLATVVESISQAHILELSPRILELEQVQGIAKDGRVVNLPSHKILAADYSECRPDLKGTENELVPLHIPKNSYRPIENGEIASVLNDSLEGIEGAKLSCAGTLERGKKFFLNVSVGEDLQVKTRQGKDKILGNLIFTSSHDGTLGFKVYDSTVRVVCMNTLRWSLEAQGEVGFSVWHTAGADIRMKNLPALVNAILKGRTQFVECMEELAKIQADIRAMREIPKGYFLANQGSDELATRSLNACEEITRLSHNGRGNYGETLYDLANGATEYWTSGDGCGKKASAAERKYKAEFGMAADHKTRFVAGLLHEPTRKEWQKLGAQSERVSISMATAG
jgi:hypothetical protein